MARASRIPAHTYNLRDSYTKQMSNQQKKQTQRYRTIDALRGIAALAVAIFHLFKPAYADANGVSKAVIGAVAQFGFIGVPIFFVISGFVISSTIASREVNYRFVGKFALKRSIRLDPPYWLSIFIDISLLWMTIHFFHHKTKDIPSPETVLAHLFYAQDLLGVGQIADIYWTLCLEIQFYLFFALIFAIGNSLSTTKALPFRGYFIASIFFISSAYSLLIMSGIASTPLHGLFISNWYLFMLGVCSQLDDRVKNSREIYLAFIVSVCIGVIYTYASKNTLDYYSISGVLTSALIFTAKRKNKLFSWLNHRPLLFLGSISYSLYLFHAIIGERFIGVSKIILSKMHISTAEEWVAFLLFFSSLVVSSAFSFGVYKLVEQPALSISKLIKPNKKTRIIEDLNNSKETYPEPSYSRESP